jgi:starch phosphorylase
MLDFRTIIPNHFALPARISRLGELAYNLWWTWNPEAQRLYQRIDEDLWHGVEHNPVLFLRRVERAALNAAANARSFQQSYDRVLQSFDDYMTSEDTWFRRYYPRHRFHPIAYFSMEFGLHESIPIYAGGLGVLSGDHAREASDMGLPFVGIGLFYRQGYFHQRITEDGWQEAYYPTHNLEDLPVRPVMDAAGQPVSVTVELPERSVDARIWEIRVGRVPVYMLDTNIETNAPADRALTARLYSSNQEVKISQEILLGIGGVRALRIMGYNPNVWHMNEGHAAFLVLERMRELIAAGRTFEQAAQFVKDSNVFTTHTPVPAGNDEFPVWLVERYFANYWPQLDREREQFIQLARHAVSWGDTFSMPVLALRFSEGRNAVSELHGQVTRKMWNFIWPTQKVDDVPITHITNGIHTGMWLARRLRILYDRYLGPDWMDKIDDPDTWEKVNDIPDAQLWVVRRHLKRKLAHFMRERARRQWMHGGVHPVQTIASGVLMDPYALTLGFARRFAPYKRGNLLLQDVDRLLRIVNNASMPVQIIFAGKSHPDHEGGKLLIQEVYRAVKKAEFGGRLVFLEGYDINLARYLVQGVDVWLNTPRRPNEASGTSGQKAALNGVLNCSVYDGWWREGYNGANGWAIGKDMDYADPEAQDRADAQSLYDLLENEIVPLYYQDRNMDGLPEKWILRMKESIRTLAPQFSTRRMVREYVEKMYLPAMPDKP